jgi:hypothetical protein
MQYAELQSKRARSRQQVSRFAFPPSGGNEFPSPKLLKYKDI